MGPCDRATRDRASAIYPARAGGLAPVSKLSGTTAVLHRKGDAPNAARAAGTGGAAAGAADDEAAAGGGSTAGGRTVKT